MDFCIGCYTPEGGEGLHRVRREGNTLRLLESDGALQNTGFLCVNRAKTRLWAASEMADAPENMLLGVYDIESGRFRLLNTCSLEGHGPCFLALDEKETEVFGANYDAGSLSIFETTGDEVRCRQIIRHSGSGPNPERQEAPHVHQTLPDKRGLLHVVDLGIDAIVTYRKTDDGLYKEFCRTPLEPGYGPRHMVWHEDGDTAYVCYELGNHVSALRWNGRGFDVLQTLPTLPEGFDGFSACAAIHRLGDRVAVSNRGHDSLALFRIGPDGLLTPDRIIPAEVGFPRDFALLEDGAILTAGQHSNDLALLVPSGSGYAVADRLALTAPVCVVQLG